MLIRLQKYPADRGVASRRKCEEYIKDGLVKVNGAVVREMGIKVDPEKDKIETQEGLEIRVQNFVYYAFHKPVGYVCTVTGNEGPKIMQFFEKIPERIFPVGRLDKDTSGLLLMTNDGRFAYEITHPKFEKEKEYVIKIKEKATDATVSALQQSIFITGERTTPADVEIIGPHLVRITIKEGRNRQIRRLCRKAGIFIEKLKRVRIDSLELGNLQSGEFRRLTNKEIEELRR
jgi:pseudouridine synthase